jgi:hypothetical protein
MLAKGERKGRKEKRKGRHGSLGEALRFGGDSSETQIPCGNDKQKYRLPVIG